MRWQIEQPWRRPRLPVLMLRCGGHLHLLTYIVRHSGHRRHLLLGHLLIAGANCAATTTTSNATADAAATNAAAAWNDATASAAHAVGAGQGAQAGCAATSAGIT